MPEQTESSNENEAHRDGTADQGLVGPLTNRTAHGGAVWIISPSGVTPETGAKTASNHRAHAQKGGPRGCGIERTVDSRIRMAGIWNESTQISELKLASNCQATPVGAAKDWQITQVSESW